MKRLALLVTLALAASPVAADLATARADIAAARFVEAREALIPLADAGNAEAEAQLAAIYGLGLGTPRDLLLAFAFYQRAALKGHPGAQAGLAAYYEQGLGLPAPDPLRAWVWYQLAVIGGEAHADLGAQALAPQLSAEEIAKATELVHAYRRYLYPFHTE